MLAEIALILLVPKVPAFPLTIASIMRGPALIGGAPRNLEWSADGSKLYFNWAKADGTQNPKYGDFEVKKDGTGLGEAAERDAIDRIPTSADTQTNRTIYSIGGDLYLFDRSTRASRRLSRTSEQRSGPVFIDGGKAVAFEQNSNLYRMNLETGETVQLTVLQQSADAQAPEADKSASQTALQDEESKLFKYSGGGGFGGGGRRRGGRRGRGSSTGITTISVPKGLTYGGMTVSPSAKWVAVSFFKEGTGTRPTVVPNYVTRSGYTEEIPSYEKVGDRSGSESLKLYSLESDSVIDLTLPRAARPERVRWSPDGSKMVVYARSDDHKDSWLEEFDATKGAFAQIWNEHDDAWVGGPGAGTVGWLPDGSRVYFESESTGYAQLYSCAPDGKDMKALTSGDFEVSDVRLDSSHQRFTFLSNEGSPAKRHLDWVRLFGGERTKLADLSLDDESTYAINPDGQTVATVKSTSNRPSELFLNGKQLTTTPTAEWLRGPWIVPPIVKIRARDGVEVPGHLYKPANLKKGSPAVIFVHGAGYLQNVYEGWSYYYREYMFHHLLVSMGYVVLDLDYRGSAGYGKAWRTAIYRHMGGKDLEDQVDGARWLVEKFGVDPKRIGIYGGSYGGFITLMAMFTTPDVFAAGAALRPVSDWANYNDGYTSEILNLPQGDAEAYKRSSPIYFAEGLKGSLLICHGMVDTNVHFQDSVRLTERLIELGKRNWQLAPFPVEDHSFVHPESWTDEYRRILELFERTIGGHRAVN